MPSSALFCKSTPATDCGPTSWRAFERAARDTTNVPSAFTTDPSRRVTKEIVEREDHKKGKAFCFDKLQTAGCTGKLRKGREFSFSFGGSGM